MMIVIMIMNMDKLIGLRNYINERMYSIYGKKSPILTIITLKTKITNDPSSSNNPEQNQTNQQPRKQKQNSKYKQQITHEINDNKAK